MTTANISENARVGIRLRTGRNLIGESAGLYFRNLLPLFVFAAMAETAFFFGERSADLIKMALYGASGLLWLAAFGSTVHLVGRRCTNEKSGAIESYILALRKVPHMLVAGLFYIAALTIAALLSVAIIGIPLFFHLLVGWFFASQAILIENEGPLSALRRSRALVKGHWWSTFSRILASLLILSLLLLTSGVGVFYVSDSSIADILGIVLSALAFPIVPMSATIIYMDLRVRHGGKAAGATERELTTEAAARELPAEVAEREAPPEAIEAEPSSEVVEDGLSIEVTGAEQPAEVTEVIAADKWQCMVCESVYDPEAGDTDRGIAPGTPYEDLPEDWECASCGTSKDWFENVALRDSGEESAFRELRLEMESSDQLVS